jgi:ABC-type phosphate/phosphonate transport system ATPase subunit
MNADTAAPPALLHAEGIVKRFGGTEVLKGVSVKAHQGDVISMIGASGSGKSTFLRCLNLLEQPNAGRISLDGEDLALVSDEAGTLKAAVPKQLQRLRSKVSMVFQHFNLWAHMTALQRPWSAPRSACSRWVFTTGAMPTRPICPVANSSAWPSPARWRWSRGSCCSTSQPQLLTPNSWAKC